MVVNTAGLQIIADGGAPRIITGTARIAMSGGFLVVASGASAAVSSGVNSFDTTDITFTDTASGALFTGVVLNQVASGTNNYVSVMTRGMVIVTAAGTVVAGELVGANGDHAVVARGVTNQGSGALIGRALTGAGSEGFVIIDLHG